MIKDGWFDWAIRDPGPINKTNIGINPAIGVIPHSAEGYWLFLRTLLWDPNRRASWGASNLADGRFFQHYSVHARTWTSGAGWPNNNFFAFENEGIASEPLTDAQVDNIVRVIRDLSTAKNWEPRRPSHPRELDATLYEHNECVRFGAAPTACPSGRIPWGRILAELEEDMAERVWCSDRLQTWIIGKHGAAPILDPVQDKVYEVIYGPHTKAMTGAQLDALKPK